MVWQSALFINHSAQPVSRGELNEHFRNICKNLRPVAEIIFLVYLVVRTIELLQDVCMYACCCFSRVPLFTTLWTVTHQAPLSMESSGTGVSSSRGPARPGDPPTPLLFPALGGMFCTTSATWEAWLTG